MGLFQINTNPVGDSLAAMGQGFLEQQEREKTLALKEQAIANQEKQLDISFERARIYQQQVEGVLAEREETRRRADAMVRSRPDYQMTRQHLLETGGPQAVGMLDHFTPNDDEFWSIIGKSLPEIEKRRKDKDLRGLMELEKSGILEPVAGADGKEMSWIEAQIAAGATHDGLMEAAQGIVGEKRQEQRKRRGAESLRDRIRHDLDTPVIAGSLSPEDVEEVRGALSDVEFILENNPSDEDGLREAYQRYRDATDDEDTRKAKADNEVMRRMLAEREFAIGSQAMGIGAQSMMGIGGAKMQVPSLPQAPPEKDSLGFADVIGGAVKHGTPAGQLARGLNAGAGAAARMFGWQTPEKKSLGQLEGDDLMAAQNDILRVLGENAGDEYASGQAVAGLGYEWDDAMDAWLGGFKGALPSRIEKAPGPNEKERVDSFVQTVEEGGWLNDDSSIDWENQDSMLMEDEVEKLEAAAGKNKKRLDTLKLLYGLAKSQPGILRALLGEKFR